MKSFVQKINILILCLGWISAQDSTSLIIKQYSDSGSLNKQQFRRLYKNLGCISSIYSTQPGLRKEKSHSRLVDDECVSNVSCLSVNNLFNMHAVNSEITEQVLKETIPEIIMNIQNCYSQNSTEPQQIKQKTRPSPGVVWGYGIGFAILIFIISNLGALLAPFMGVKLFDQILMFLVAMAVGTLTATALLVLIPEALDLLVHEELNEIYIEKMSTVCGALMFFFLSERLIKFLVKKKRKRKSTEFEVNSGDTDQTLIESIDDQKPSTTSELAQNGHGHSHGIPLPETSDLQSVSSVAYMIVVGDGLHKFVDGLSVGAAFSDNLLTGMTVGLSMICEEVAHEIGDIAMLLHAGLSIKKALLYNSLAAIFCFAGVAVGIILGETTSANQWIFALAAGIFLYVALVDMLPEMGIAAELAVEKNSSPLFITVFQTVGLVIGFFIIVLVAMFVGDIQL